MFDTHCHLIDPQFKNDLEAVLKRARSVGIIKIVNAGYDLKTSLDTVALSKKIPWLLPAIGIHPNDAADESLEEMGEIEEILKDEKIIAIGETGLDYYRNPLAKDAMRELFVRHIDIARKNCLPLLIHTRNSIDEAIKILRDTDYHRGVFHCYSGTYEQAKKIIDMGFYLGFGGVLTFSKRVREVLKNLPKNKILLETDAPFLAPQEHRGKRNEPAYIIETLNTAGSILGMAPEELEDILDQNATALFSFNRK